MVIVARKLSDEDLLVALLTSKSQAEAAQKLGVSKQTVTRRVNAPAFKDKFLQYRKNILDNVNTQLVNGTQEAVNVLVGLLKSKNEVTRYNASSRILSLAQDYLSMQDIMDRLDKLEQEQDEN